MGEDLGPLSSKELESLERQLDMSLKQIRSTRVLFLLLIFKYVSPSRNLTQNYAENIGLYTR